MATSRRPERLPLVVIGREWNSADDGSWKPSTPSWRLEEATLPSVLLKTLACSDVAAIVLVDSSRDAAWSKALPLALKLLPARTAPLWIERTKDQSWTYNCADRTACEVVSTPFERLQVDLASRHSRREYLDGSFIEGGGMSPEEVLETLTESMTSARHDLRSALPQLDDALVRGSISSAVAAMHRLRGIVGQFGDLRLRHRLDMLLPAVKEGKEKFDQQQLDAIKQMLDDSIGAMKLYEHALKLELNDL